MKKSMTARLMIGAFLAAASASAFATSVFSSATYNDSTTFSDALSGTTMTISFDGTNYWSASGGSSSGVRFAQYNASGTIDKTYSPGLDFRSVFTDANNNILARKFASNTIYKQTAPGIFTSLLNLTGGSLDAQSAVVKDGSNFVALGNGSVTQWNASGAYISTISLNGLSGSETTYPQNRGIAVAGNYWLTYNNNLLSAWDHSGHRVGSTTLIGAGTSFDSYFSLSYANNMAFIVDNAKSTWRGYDVGIASANANANANAVPEPGTYAMLLAGLGLMGFTLRRCKTS